MRLVKRVEVYKDYTEEDVKRFHKMRNQNNDVDDALVIDEISYRNHPHENSELRITYSNRY